MCVTKNYHFPVQSSVARSLRDILGYGSAERLNEREKSRSGFWLIRTVWTSAHDRGTLRGIFSSLQNVKFVNLNFHVHILAGFMLSFLHKFLRIRKNHCNFLLFSSIVSLLHLKTLHKEKGQRKDKMCFCLI